MDEEKKKERDELKELLAKIQKEKEELIAIMEAREKQKAEDTISGQSEAGMPAPPVDEEEEERKRINKVLEPTGMSI